MGKVGDLWEVHDQDKKGTTHLYRLDAEGIMVDLDVEYPKPEAARRKRQAKEVDKKVAKALLRPLILESRQPRISRSAQSITKGR